MLGKGGLELLMRQFNEKQLLSEWAMLDFLAHSAAELP